MHVFAHSRDPHPAIKLWCQVPITKFKRFFQIEIYRISALWKANISKVELSMIKIGELLRKLLALRSCFFILPPGHLLPSSRDWRCNEAWREQTLAYPPVMCQQRLSYCTWELNFMMVSIWKKIKCFVYTIHISCDDPCFFSRLSKTVSIS